MTPRKPKRTRKATTGASASTRKTTPRRKAAPTRKITPARKIATRKTTSTQKTASPPKTKQSPGQYDYDVVLSFAGEDRPYAKKVATLLQRRNIKVFYDYFQQHELWGEDLYDYLADVYTNKARFCIMFLSEHYAKKLWTTHERQNAQARAFRERKAYILPVKIDDTEIPSIRSTVGYMDLRQDSVADIVSVLEKKLGRTELSKPTTPRTPRKSATPKDATTDANIPLPKVRRTFTQQEKDKFLQDTFKYIKQYFQRAIKGWKEKEAIIDGAVTPVDATKFICKLYVNGDLKSQCKIWIAESYRSHSINYSDAAHNILSDNSYSESLTVEENGYEMYLKFAGMKVYYPQQGDATLTKQKAAEHLWKLFIERVTR